MAVTASPAAFGLIENNPLTVAAPGLLGGDLDTSGTPAHVSGFTRPAHGTLALNPDGSFAYTPDPGYVGADGFTYTAADAAEGSATAAVSLNVAACDPMACVFAGPRLASVDTAQGTLFNALVGGLTGSGVNLTALDWTGLAQGQINGGRLAGALQAELGVSSPSQALAANASLPQVFTAAAAAARADGDTADADAFDALAASAAGQTGTVRLGDLIRINPNDGSLADSSINALDLATGAAQLYNFDNVATTPTPVTVSGADLGLPAAVGSVAISAQAVEPPVITCGGAGTQFHSSAVRLKADLNLSDDDLDLGGLSPALQAALGDPAVQASGSLGQLSLYTEVAEGQGTVAAIDALTGAVTLNATPGVADVYLGDIPDNLFFDRAHVIDPATDLGYGDAGTFAVTSAGNPGLDATAGIQVRSFALGQAPSATTEVFSGPFPQSQTVTTSAAFLSNLATTLADNLSVRLSGPLGADLNPLVSGTIQPAVAASVGDAAGAVLTPALTGAVDPALQDLGTGLGELVLTVNGESMSCPPIANPDAAFTPEGAPVTVPVLANDAAPAGDLLDVSAVTQPAHGRAALNPNGTITYTPQAGYSGPDGFAYTAADTATGLTSTATVSLDVATPPVAQPDAYAVPENTHLEIQGPGVLANDNDPGGLPLGSAVATGPAHGSLALNPDGSFTYTPDPGYSGPDGFTYRANDGISTSAPAAVSIAVEPPAEPPVADDDAYSTPEGTPLTVAASGVLANDSDPLGKPIASALVTPPSHGTVALNPDGSFTYTPAPGYAGGDAFTYRDTDGTLASAPAVVRLTVSPAAVSGRVAPGSDTGPSDTDGITNDNTPTIEGTAPAGSTVVLTATPAGQGTPVVVGQSTAGPDGSYQVTSAPLADGVYVFAVASSAGGSAPAGTLDVATRAPVLASGAMNSAFGPFRLTFASEVPMDPAGLLAARSYALSGNYHRRLAVTAVAPAAGAAAGQTAVSLAMNSGVYCPRAVVRLTALSSRIEDLAGNHLSAGATAHGVRHPLGPSLAFAPNRVAAAGPHREGVTRAPARGRAPGFGAASLAARGGRRA